MRFEDLHATDVDKLSKAEQQSMPRKMARAEADVNALLHTSNQPIAQLELAPQVARRNFDKPARDELYQLFHRRCATNKNVDQRAFSSEMHRTAAVLKDVESPGALRKPGPTLRFVRHKLDPVFLYDWTTISQELSVSPRHAAVLRLWDHLHAEPKGLATAQEFEPVEVHGIVTYLQGSSQQFVPLERLKESMSRA